MTEQQIQERLALLKKAVPGMTPDRAAATEAQLRALTPSPAPNSGQGAGRQG